MRRSTGGGMKILIYECAARNNRVDGKGYACMGPRQLQANGERRTKAVDISRHKSDLWRAPSFGRQHSSARAQREGKEEECANGSLVVG